ncbi:hypothetical protein N2603_32005 [Bradyrhizobium huanghuaihaiense]|uniref:hypothetical protein n=1 Tax=Bradyrhizobium huanghuaihaiense TaxID=990078 RepID=UPI0021A9B7E8|nr:hypothetical protein [Bradyrhizobium sp. CB3035]UWU74647.1 hypothetical protein N2603_32005 [Bradyrhizobium sp. CB3035]
MPTEPQYSQLTLQDAEAVLDRAQQLMSVGDIAAVMKTFAADVVVRLRTFPKPAAGRRSRSFCSRVLRVRRITGCKNNCAPYRAM